MKRFSRLLIASFIAIGAASLSFAEKKIVQEQDFYEYNNLVISLDKPSAPVVDRNYIIFTAETGPRFVGIAFDFENYSVIHSFKIHNTRNLEDKITRSIMFYLLEKPSNLSEISYRLIVDGLWTADPLNPVKEYDYSTGITLSKVSIPDSNKRITNKSENDVVTFVYNGESGQTVRLAGNFTNWDSWIYQLEETSPGFYELSLPLPTGTYYYNYYLGMNSLVDKTNPNRAYTDEGRTASVITIN